MPTRNTPGVYIQEISTLPASIAAVATAVPAFIGFTQKAEKDGVVDSLLSIPTRITSMLEYEQYFGGADPEALVLTVTDIFDDVQPNTAIDVLVSRSFSAELPSTLSIFNLYYSLQMFFRNGGGACYIVAIGKYDATSTSTLFENGIKTLEKVDEPTLLVFPDAVNLTTGYGDVVQAALGHCAKLQDRFTIADTVGIDGGNKLDTAALLNFRTDIGNNDLKYGAVYFPNILTSLNFGIDPSSLDVIYKTENLSGASGEYVFNVSANSSNYPNKTSSLTNPEKLDLFESIFPSLYRTLLAEIKKHYVTLPPSGAIAGIYARVDGNRGVWKAPANVSINSIIGPTIKLTNADQDLLNVDASTGKSINAIRTFAGKGTLVWGARTLAGNDNEWRYVPVRRLYIFVEESIKKATEFVVFEANDRNTWVRVKSMIENFLTGLWREGALAGAKPDDAFFVKVGLGETMTSDDILNGIMNVEIGMAAVRPAEFIILKFSHKLQES